VDKLQNDLLPKLEKYEKQEKLLAGRNSYSKTDTDATFMRTKEDHLQNGQLKPSYNIQLGTENQYIINYTIHQTPSDMAVFTTHMADTLKILDSIGATAPKRICADAGYGSEENYQYLEQNDIEAFVKYPGYYKEQNNKASKRQFPIQSLYYNTENDYFICPMGQKLTFVSTAQKTTKTGFEQTIHKYQAGRCSGCPLRGACHRAQGKRTIEINYNSKDYREQAKQRLKTLKGRRMRIQRNIDVEAVFGHIKQARGFRRFLLCGLEGVNTELGLLALGITSKNGMHISLNERELCLCLPIIIRKHLKISKK